LSEREFTFIYKKNNNTPSVNDRITACLINIEIFSNLSTILTTQNSINWTTIIYVVTSIY